MQQKTYYKEIIISLIAAIAVGLAFNALIGLVSFFVIGSLLSKGSVPKEEMDNILTTNNLDNISNESLNSNSISDDITDDFGIDNSTDIIFDVEFSNVEGNIYNH